MAIVIKGIKLLTKKGAERLALKGKRKLDPTKRAANRKRFRQQYKAIGKRSLPAGTAGRKGAVPVKKQSAVKSTLSGRTYTVNLDTFKKTAALGAFGPKRTTPMQDFQSSVKDLIGLDQLSVRKAHRAYFKARERRKNRIKKKMLGGLLTKGIKMAYKEMRKAGTRTSREIMKIEGVDKKTAQSDIKFGLRNVLKGNLKRLQDRIKRRTTIQDIRKLEE